MVVVTPPLSCGEALGPAAYAEVRRRAIFDCCKWDPQVGDVASLARVPLVLSADAWSDLAAKAAALAGEILDAERELVGRPDLWRQLALPWRVRRALARAADDGPPAGVARLIRFDFHPTAGRHGNGWRISEANTDVPGGFVEAGGFTRLVARALACGHPTGDPVAAYADAFAKAVPPGTVVALVHATSFADDRQVMVCVGRELAARGLRAELVSPEHLRWERGRARLETDWTRAEVAAVVRFFPGEWLPNCHASSGWRHFFAGAATPLSNPATALLTQSKRLPLVWDRLQTPLRTWRELLPETRPFRARDADAGWVVKPALGRVGEGVAIDGVTPDRERRAIVRAARLFPRHWVMQRRFEPLPIHGPDGPLHVCIGVFTVDARAVGVYARVAQKALIDHRAQDAAVVVAGPRSRGAAEVRT